MSDQQIAELQQWVREQLDSRSKITLALHAAQGRDVHQLTVASRYVQQIVVNQEGRLKALEEAAAGGNAADLQLFRRLAASNHIAIRAHDAELDAITDRLNAAAESLIGSHGDAGGA